VFGLGGVLGFRMLALLVIVASPAEEMSDFVSELVAHGLKER